MSPLACTIIFMLAGLVGIARKSLEEGKWIASESALELIRVERLFKDWQEARPFLWASQSAYARSLLLKEISLFEEIRRYLPATRQQCDNALAYIRQQLNESPPPYLPEPLRGSFIY